MYEADVDMNVDCDGFQIWNAGIFWFQIRKPTPPPRETEHAEWRIMCRCGLSNEAENSFWSFLIMIIRRADYRAEITV